jgi:hypothetical protein
MDDSQKEKLYQTTGFREPESYLTSLRDKGISFLKIFDKDNILWECGFARYCMENYEFDNIKDGVIIQL